MNQPGPSSLLIVDEEEAVRDALSRRLERRGFRVTTCPDGHRALEVVRERPFDLVLLDVMMPGLDGFQVLEALRSRFSIAELPVIMVTAKHESEEIVRALDLGANDFISKPIDFPVALARIQNQLALRRSNAQAVAVFQSMLARCLEHFFPETALEVQGESATVAWQAGGSASFRLGEPGAGPGVVLQCFRSRYRLIPEGPASLADEDRRLLMTILRVMDLRFRAMFDLTMADRLEFADHMPEDLVVAEHLCPSAPGRVLDALEALRVAGLSTYENRRVSTGALLLGGEEKAGASGGGDGRRTMRFDVRLTAIRSFLRLCDGLHTLFLVNRTGQLAGLVDIDQWVGEDRDAAAERVPACPRAYRRHALATRDGRHLCLVLAPTQEIKVFAGGSLVFAYREARWHLLDIPTKFAAWSQALGATQPPDLAARLFEATLNLCEGRHGALFLVLRDPDVSLPELLEPGDRIIADAATGDARTPSDATPRPTKSALHDLVRGRGLVELGGATMEALAGLDGAVVTDREGRLHAFGAILRARSGVGAIEGARASAALGASYHGPVLKVSEDGSLAMFLDGQRVWVM
jgi:CheY-like chemotaxis protein